MSIATEITRLQNAKAALKESIEAKGVTVEDSAKLDEYPALVDSIPQSSGEVEEKDVNFYDYDGTCLYTYTKDEFLALSEMPALPDHSDEGLSNEGWNWTLEDCKEQVRETEGNNIAAIYEPTDGTIKIFIDITDLNIPMFISLRCGYYNSVEIDWGDNSEKSSNYNTIGMINFEHNYQNLGAYIISIKCLSQNAVRIESYLFKDIYETQRGGCGRFVNKIFLSKNFLYYEPIFAVNIKIISLPNISINTSFNFATSKLIFIGIPNGFNTCPSCSSTLLNNISFSKTIFNYPMYCLSNTFLKNLYLPKNDATNIIVSTDAFRFKVKDKKLLIIPSNFKNILSLPEGFETIIFKGVITSTKFPSDNTNFKTVIFEEGTVTFSTNFVNSNYMLTKIILPSTITSIDNNSSIFYAYYDYLYLYANIPPTLSSSTLNLDKIYVPAESVEAYKAATNWSALADKIFPIPTE